MAELDYQYLAGVVEKAKRGNSDAFAELYAATYQKQYAFSYHYLHDEYLAQDALQETFILALKHLNNLKDAKLFVSWLNQINSRVCYNMKRRLTVHQTELSDYEAADIDHKASADAGPENEVLNIDEKEYIMKQVLALPFSESQAILLRYYSDMKISDIADLMEISVSSVKRYLKSGQDRLARALRK